jgi:N-acyl-D-aspartate/D-glutamate deacylase
MLPPWLYAEGWDKAREILADPVGREKVKQDLDRYWRFLAYGQWDRLLYVVCNYLPGVSDTPFAQLVEKSGKEPVDVFLDIMMAAPTMEAAGIVGLRGTVFDEQILIDSVATDPLYMWMTDTGVYSEESTTGGILDFMSMTHFFVRYVKELGVISIQDAVKKVGLTPARHFMLEGRGVLTPGNFADINVFSLDDLKINATLTDPRRYSSGMDYVIVNGEPVIARGKHTGARPGRTLRHLPKR